MHLLIDLNHLKLYCKGEGEKKRKYGSAYVARRASFTRLCVFVDGMLGKEVVFLLISFLIVFPPKPYSVVMGWFQARLAFAVLRATPVCVTEVEIFRDY